MALMVEVFHNLPPGWHDATPAIMYGSLTVRLNTLDFSLIDPVNADITFPSDLIPGQAIRILALGWIGTISSVESRDPVDIRSGHAVYVITATNTDAPLVAAGGASISLSDLPTTVTDTILFEDGSGGVSLESGSLTDPGLVEMEGASPGYQRLSIRTQANGVAVGVLTAYPLTSTLGKLITFQDGLRPGMQFTLYSNNQGIAGTLYTATEITITWPGGQPVYEVTFGLPASVTSQDPPWTLAKWSKAIANG